IREIDRTYFIQVLSIFYEKIFAFIYRFNKKYLWISVIHRHFYHLYFLESYKVPDRIIEISSHKPINPAPKKINMLKFDKLELLALTIIIAEAKTSAAIIMAKTIRLTILLISTLFFSQFKISKLIRVRPLVIVSNPFLREVGNSNVSEVNRIAFTPIFSSVRCLRGEKPSLSLR